MSDDISKELKNYQIMYPERFIYCQLFVGDGTGDSNWQIGIETNFLNARSKEWRQGGRTGMLRQFLASAGSVVLKAGKEVAKEVALRGARSALGV